MFGGILFLVIECKFNTPVDDDNLVQLFLELLSAAEQNKQHDLAGLCIYGLWTDLTMFKFYSYDPSTAKFCFDEVIVPNIRRADASYSMIGVANKIFGLILTAYMDSLQAIISRRKDWAQCNDVNQSAIY
ncbi:hypothetical protein JB92DRAFT_3082843 [Gautieria morchelliformis]|nr:hypothetical protein JB92DRAFT_3082843 [Gautieria morchelliformis]